MAALPDIEVEPLPDVNITTVDLTGVERKLDTLIEYNREIKTATAETNQILLEIRDINAYFFVAYCIVWVFKLFSNFLGGILRSD